MKKTIIALSLIATAGAAHATNTPGADCVGVNACKTNSDNRTTHNTPTATAEGGHQWQHQQQNASASSGGNHIAPQTTVSYSAPNQSQQSINVGNGSSSYRYVNVRPVTASTVPVVAPSANITSIVSQECGPRQRIVARNVNGRIINILNDTETVIGEDMHLIPDNEPYRRVQVTPDIVLLMGHRIVETTSVVTTSTSGAFAFGANGSSGAGGSIGGNSGGALQRMVTTIRLHECQAFEFDTRPLKPRG